MSVVLVLWVVLAAGHIGVAVAALLAWRRRMRESLPAPDTARQHFYVDGERHDRVADRRIPAAVRRTPRAA